MRYGLIQDRILTTAQEVCSNKSAIPPRATIWGIDTPKNGHPAGRLRCPLSANTGHHHSITSSARPSSGSGIVKFRTLAVFRLMKNSTLVDLLYGQVGRFVPVENTPSVGPCLAISINDAAAIAHETARGRKFAYCIGGTEPSRTGKTPAVAQLGMSEQVFGRG